MPENPEASGNWPSYLSGPRDDIFAIGVISLNYGKLENSFRILFSNVAHLNDFQAAAIFNRLPNNHRKDVLLELMAKSILPQKLRDRIRYFAKGFTTCSGNRHDIMHSHSGGVYTSQSRGERGILLSKYTKQGAKRVCPASLENLKITADEIHQYAIFGSVISTEIKSFLAFREKNDGAAFWQIPLRDKPPPPTPLSWHSPKDVLIDPAPPQSSQE